MNSNIERYSSIEQPYAYRLYERPEEKPSNEVQKYPQKERDGLLHRHFQHPLFHIYCKTIIILSCFIHGRRDLVAAALAALFLNVSQNGYDEACSVSDC